MKKIVIFVLLCFLSFSLTACGQKQESKGSSQYEIGDIVLSDGSVVKGEDITAIDDSNIPVAIIAGFREAGGAFGIGVHRSDSPLQWKTEDSNTPDNSPACHFVNTYAEKYKLTGVFASDWYMPSIEELRDIYQNREALNTSLRKIYALDNNAAMDGLGTNWYWSSSESDSEDDYVWFVHFLNGYAGECPKNFTNVHVLAARTI